MERLLELLKSNLGLEPSQILREFSALEVAQCLSAMSQELTSMRKAYDALREENQQLNLKLGNVDGLLESIREGHRVFGG